MKMSRRGFLKMVGLGGAAAVAAAPGKARASAREEAVGLLVDTTLCVGCRGCEVACSEQHGTEIEGCGDKAVFEQRRVTTPGTLTVVNRLDAPGKDGSPRYAKSQCMHCVEPACASACLARALDKTPEGPVVYHQERCLGCRYCMIACPFEIPRFEYDKAAPAIRKCELCAQRKDGKGPACAEACPSGALMAGSRAELLEIATARVWQNPDKYVHHVYGEHEVGGTSVLYLADVAFEKLGLRTDLGSRGYPELTQGALGVVPFVMTLWPPLLMGLYTFAKAREERVSKSDGTEGSHD
ncbi:MAG: 4Fe-4S dicluster domain-containing protein [Deltaproteobacteria bacterium]|nr:4Fe-4S dicluster domain-containing protein [Deltaproteobacteria bacterium]